MKKFFTLLTILGLSIAANAQFSIDAVNTTYTQDFTSLTGATWTNNTTPITGWYAKTDVTASITTLAVNTGSTTTGALYSFGVLGVNALSDKSLGYVASNGFTGGSGTGKGYVGWRLKNNTGSTIATLTVTYDGEQWRKENNASSNSITVEYQTGATVTDLTANTWTSAGAGLTFTSPIIGATTATVLDGNASANRVADLTATITFGTPLAAGDEVMIRFSDLNDAGTDHVISIDNVRVIAQAPTSISLVKFTADKISEKVKLNWVTATEINNDKFVVERSADGENFELVSEVKGAGNSREINSYNVVDAAPLKGTSYYRLTQVDFNGASETFAPVAVNMSGKLHLATVQSNTEAGNIDLNIYSPSATSTAIRITDLSGRTIASQQVNLVEGYQSVNLNTNNLSSGIHIIQIMNGEEVVMKKLVL